MLKFKLIQVSKGVAGMNIWTFSQFYWCYVQGEIYYITADNILQTSFSTTFGWKNFGKSIQILQEFVVIK